MRDIALFDYETDVDLRSALRNHAYVDPGARDGAEHAGRDSRTAMDVFSNQANNRLLVFGSDIRDSLKFRQERSGKTLSLHGKGHAYFRNRHKVNRRAIAVESLKHRSQKSVDHYSTGGNHVHNAHIGLGGNGSEHVVPGRRMGGDPRALARGIA